MVRSSTPPAIFMLTESIENVGGMEYQAIRLSRRLTELGHAIAIIEACPFRGYLLERKRLRDELAGIPLWRLPALKRRRPLFFASYGASSALTLMLLRERFDVLHIHLLAETALPAVLTAKRLGKPVIAKLASAGEPYGDLARLRRRTHPRVIRALLGGVDQFVALTPELRQELIHVGVGPERIALIPNGVDTAAFCPAATPEARIALRAELGLPSGLIFLFVGRLVPKKRLDLLLGAWERIRQQLAGAHLIIVGNGPLYASLVQQAHQAHVGNSVSFVGASHRVADYLRAVDVFVLPSVSEGLSNALLEAMSSALVPVVTASGGVQDIVRDGENGRVFRDETPEGLARVLIEVAQSPELRLALGRAARSTVEMGFSLESVTRRYQDLYSTLLGRPQTGDNYPALADRLGIN